MARQGGSISITTFDDSKTLNNVKCLDKYDEVVDYIEDKIDQFNKQKHNGFEEWVKLNEQINIKEKDLNECYRQELLTVYLNNSEKIKGFKDICTKDPKCPNNPEYRPEVPAKVQAKAEDSCAAKKNCVEKTKPAKEKSEPKEKGSKSHPGEGTKTHETGTAEGKKLLQKGPPHDQGEESTQEQLIQQVPPVTNPSDDFAENDVDARESRKNRPSGIPEQLETQEGSTPSLEAPAGQTDTSSSKDSSAEDSDQKGSPEVVDLSRREHQSNSDDGASSGSNLADQQTFGKHSEGQAHSNKGVTAETSDGVALSLKAPSRGVNVKGSHVHNENNGADTEEASSQRAAVSRVDTGSVNLANATSGDVTRGATPTGHVKPAVTLSGEQTRDVVTNGESSSHTGVLREGKEYKILACVTRSAKYAHSECTYDRNLNQPVTSNNASHYKTVFDDIFIGGDRLGGAGNVIRSANDNTHLSLAETPRNSIGHNFSDQLASQGEQIDRSSLPKVAPGLSQEGNDTIQGTVHQDVQCQNENLPSQLKACINPQLDNLENVHEQQKGQEKGALPSSPGLTQQIPTYTVGNTYPQRSDQIPIYLTS